MSICQGNSWDLQNISISRLHLHYVHIYFAYTIYSWLLKFELVSYQRRGVEILDMELLGH